MTKGTISQGIGRGASGIRVGGIEGGGRISSGMSTFRGGDGGKNMTMTKTITGGFGKEGGPTTVFTGTKTLAGFSDASANLRNRVVTSQGVTDLGGVARKENAFQGSTLYQRAAPKESQLVKPSEQKKPETIAKLFPKSEWKSITPVVKEPTQQIVQKIGQRNENTRASLQSIIRETAPVDVIKTQPRIVTIVPTQPKEQIATRIEKAKVYGIQEIPAILSTPVESSRAKKINAQQMLARKAFAKKIVSSEPAVKHINTSRIHELVKNAFAQTEPARIPSVVANETVVKKPSALPQASEAKPVIEKGFVQIYIEHAFAKKAQEMGVKIHLPRVRIDVKALQPEVQQDLIAAENALGTLTKMGVTSTLALSKVMQATDQSMERKQLGAALLQAVEVVPEEEKEDEKEPDGISLDEIFIEEDEIQNNIRLQDAIYASDVVFAQQESEQGVEGESFTRIMPTAEHAGRMSGAITKIVKKAVKVKDGSLEAVLDILRQGVYKTKRQFKATAWLAIATNPAVEVNTKRTGRPATVRDFKQVMKYVLGFASA